MQKLSEDQKINVKITFNDISYLEAIILLDSLNSIIPSCKKVHQQKGRIAKFS